ncbi:unnamed protein product [Allacma fusca]|uniref:Aldehyde oxidase n=1 Tax=Allacma fusca TaxID=39272 RepID=A0A8J2LPR1_9HEXA|nr:unnamed protein product [Allacma fusca]
MTFAVAPNSACLSQAFLRNKMKCILRKPQPQLPASNDTVTFLINGTQYTVSASNNGSLNPESRLVDYIRDQAKLKGTKWTCREGGCGACVVTARTKDPQTGQELVRAVNSCLTPVYACDGWDISTVEDLGNRRDGYHPIQKRLAHFGGTQCGFCSAGMVMNMYSLAMSNKNLKSQDIENTFDGNICRCTGYRPIFDAFKSFADDADPEIKKRCDDIEDCGSCPGKSSGGCCSRPAANLPSANLDLSLPTGEKWNKITDLKTTFEILNNHAKNKIKYRIVAGNTGTGVFKFDGPYDAYVEVNNVPDLSVLSVNKSEAVLGAGITLTKAIDFLENLGNTEGFKYAGGMGHHIRRVANTPVRNFGTIAGNIMMKHDHHDFPSDIFLILEAVGAKVYVASSPTDISSYKLVDFLNVDMRGRLIVYFTIPKRKGNYVYRSFKITKRHQNAHAYVNAAFLIKVDPALDFKITEKPSICFGGINPKFVHATRTEDALTGADLADPNTLKKAIKMLDEEVEPDHHLPDSTPQYRKQLTQNLLYKVVLGILGEKADGNLHSGAEVLIREQNSGRQTYDTDEEFGMSPLYKPVAKLEALAQCSGEAEYVNDIPKQQDELSGAFVTATLANTEIKTIDASEALKVPGVVTFITSKDIPGRNSFYDGFMGNGKEEVFVETEVKASGQALGLVVAQSREIALAAAKLVKVEYQESKRPVLKIKEAISKAKEEGTFESAIMYPPFMNVKSPDEPNPTSQYKIKGEFNIGGQAHVQMENHVTLVIPQEDGLLVYAATQWMDQCQMMIAKALNIPNNSIDIKVKRIGGAYGSKISRGTHVAVAAAVASHITRKPVRIVLDMEHGFEMMGKRLPYHTEYEAGFDQNGKIDALQAKVICDSGMYDLDTTSAFAVAFMQSCYNAKGWNLQPGRVTTNTHTNTFCRAPGTTQGIAIIENIMEHVADTLKKDPVEVRQANFLKPGDPLLPCHGKQHEGDIFEGVNLVPNIIEELQRSGDYEERKRLIEEFNRSNRWKKRGLALVPMRYLQGFHGMKLSAFVAIHNQDGTVSISHAGVECGQGINTKVAQTAAHTLGIPMSKIAVKAANNLTAANSDCTGGAITSELVCYAITRACQQIAERMAPIKKGLEDPSWEELVQKCNQGGIDLRGTYQYSANDADVKPYDIYGANLTEVEVDILTGEFKIVRLDLVEDAGKSLSPEIDIGQIEGSLVMGLGLWSEEKLVFDPETGRLLTRNTWEYKVPLPKCIPEDIRIVIMRNAPNPLGVLRSKATGEPPLCLAVAVLFAIKNAIKAARSDAGNTEWFQLDGPVTPEDVVRLSLTNSGEHF